MKGIMLGAGSWAAVHDGSCFIGDAKNRLQSCSNWVCESEHLGTWNITLFFANFCSILEDE